MAESRTVIGVEGDKRRLLIVDDEEDGRSLLRDLLAPLGFEIHEAPDGEAAVYEAVRLKPDAILMDLRMPRLNGLEAARQIRAMADLERTVIIAISASAFEHNRQHCIESGAHDFIPKPFRQEKLLGLLCAHLGLKLVYTRGEASAKPEAQVPMAAPPLEQLQALLDLAWRGDINNLLQQVNHLHTLDEAYSPFVTQLRTLAAAYQMKELRRWLKSLEATPHECAPR